MTAVQWLQQSLKLTFEQQMQFEGLFQQAKEMEKEQLKEMYLKAIENFDIRFKRKEKGL